jgi:hypothetical protein
LNARFTASLPRFYRDNLRIIHTQTVQNQSYEVKPEATLYSISSSSCAARTSNGGELVVIMMSPAKHADQLTIICYSLSGVIRLRPRHLCRTRAPGTDQSPL